MGNKQSTGNKEPSVKRIWLICVDGSENSNWASEETMRLATPSDELIFLHVVQSGIGDAIKKKKSEKKEDKAEARFDRL